MTTKKIKLYRDKTFEPCRIVIGDQHENEVVRVKFALLDESIKSSDLFYYAVLISPNTKRQFAIPLDAEYSWIVSNSVTETAGEWTLHLLIKSVEMIDGDATTGTVYLSPPIPCLVRRNRIRLDELENQRLESGLQIVYDQLYVAIEKAEEALRKAEEFVQNGGVGDNEFSGVQIGESPQTFHKESYLFLREVKEDG